VVPRTTDLVTTQRASGSGVVVDSDGYIVTNAHVVRGAQRLRVELTIPTTGRSILATSSRSVSGQIVGIDLETDLAVIKVDERNLPAVQFADSDDVKAGQVVLALGSPFGLHNSVSFGVVSAVARQLEPESPMIYLQTDASINSGSSGGPLVDLRGRLVGINTLIFSQNGGNDGVGFAAPSNIVRTVYEQIRKTGRVRRGELGIRPQTVTPVLAAGLGLPRNSGVVLADVIPGSPADVAGLRVGDVVVSLDGKAMENGRQFQVGLYRHVVGDIVTLNVLRDGKILEIAAAVVERLDTFSGLPEPPDPRQNMVPRLSILGLDLNRRIAEMLPALRVRSGVVVASTVDGAIDTREGGLAAGDIIYAINRKPISGIEELRAALDELKPGDPVVLQIERRGELMYLTFTLE
jgi:serine protease Do